MRSEVIKTISAALALNIEARLKKGADICDQLAALEKQLEALADVMERLNEALVRRPTDLS